MEVDGNLTLMSGPRFDQPMIEPESQEFWDGLKDGRLLIRRCGSCGDAHYYPRPFCPACWSEDVAWEEASGRATVYTYSTVFMNDLPPFAAQVPYVAAVVDLAEGPRMMTRIVGVPDEELAIGMAVTFTTAPLDDELKMAVFERA